MSTNTTQMPAPPLYGGPLTPALARNVLEGELWHWLQRQRSLPIEYVPACRAILKVLADELDPAGPVQAALRGDPVCRGRH